MILLFLAFFAALREMAFLAVRRRPGRLAACLPNSNELMREAISSPTLRLCGR